MRKGLKRLFTMCCVSLSFISGAQAFQPFKPVVAAPEGPTTFLGPTIQGNYAYRISNSTAFSILGELGVRNYRAGLTLGWQILPGQQFKLSGEYLWQRLYYSFAAGGHTSTWMQQGAVGADYLLDMGGDYLRSLELDLYGSYAPGKNINPEHGTSTVNFITFNFVNNRRIAGSAAGGVSPRINFSLWQGNLVGVEMNWDDVVYRTSYSSHQKVDGFGETIQLEQYLGDHARIYLLASWRKPFNNYQGSLSWDNFYYKGRWNAGVFGQYTSGNHRLPNSYNAGLNIDYFADCLVSEPSVKGEAGNRVAYDPSFLNWVSDPAVYMPQVLAIVDQNVKATCPQGGVSFFGAFADQAPGQGGTVIFPAAPLFFGNDLTFSISVSPALAFGDIIEIDPATGIVTITGGLLALHNVTYTVTITASNACGSATSTPFNVRLERFF